MKGKQQDFRTEKYIRYGIRKYSFGAASVAVAAYMMFGGVATVHAEAPATSTPATPASALTTKADTSKLEAAITRLEAALEKAASTEKNSFNN